MALNFSGANGKALPGVVVKVESLTAGVSVPSGARIAVIMGEGIRDETLVNKALGGGNDGVGPDGSPTGTPDGRHFLLGQGLVGELVPNRSRVFKNGVELAVFEGTVDSDPFDQRYDVRLDIENDLLELQSATLVDQGGEYFSAGANNVGDGTITNLSLIDPNAPAETWTARVTRVRRDGYGNPVDGYAIFVVRGSISGAILDGYGRQITWQSDGQIRDNGILRFAIEEGVTSAFLEGDSFVVQTQDGALRAGDSLSARYIPVADLNDPQFFTDMNKLTAKHGKPSAENALSLGAQLAFANGSPGVYALQAAPPVPRRLSYVLVDSANGQSDIEELTFALPLGVLPDVDSDINFFVTSPVTGVETQIIPNKVDFFDPAITSNPSGFVFGGTYAYSYTVVLEESVQKSATDGVLTSVTSTTATLSSATVTFNIDDLSATRSVHIDNAVNALNNGSFPVVSVMNGIVTISNPGGFVTEEDIQFQVLDSAVSSSRILFTEDLALSLGERLRSTIVDFKDADFFDAGWLAAYDAAERIDIDMVVPLPSQTISAIFQNGKVHVTNMSTSQNKRERVLMIGAISGLTPENVIGTEPAAVEDLGVLEGIQGDDVDEILAGDNEDLTDYGVPANYGDSFRVSYFYPDEIIVQAGANRIVADGFYIAAAAAGWFGGSNAIEEPLTNKTLGGFTLTRSKLFSPLVEENIVAAGVCLLRPLASGGLVLDGRTTTSSLLPEEEEQSIVFIRDRLAKDMRVAFLPFIGKAETETILQTLYARATSMMQGFTTRHLITNFRDLTVERDSVEPRQFNITVKVQPVYPVKWITVTIGLGLL